MKRTLVITIVVLLAFSSTCFAQSRGSRVFDAPSPWTQDSTIHPVDPTKPVVISTTDSGVSVYGLAASFAIDPAEKGNIVYLNGPTPTTGVSVTLIDPTFSSGNWMRDVFVIFKQPAGNPCRIAITNSNFQAPSGMTPFLTATAGAEDWMTFRFNSVTGKWGVAQGPNNMQ